MDFLSFSDIKESSGDLEVVSIKLQEMKLGFDRVIMVEILDLSNVQTKGLVRLQSLFQ